MKYLIIEDEPYAAKHLHRKIKQLRPEWELVSTLSNIDSSISYLRAHNAPDLIFSDIQLSDGLSFEIFKEVSQYIPIVFTTAYSEYALDAFRHMGIAYLLKPIDSDELEKEIQKLEKITQKQISNHLLLDALQKLQPNQASKWKERLLIKKGEKFYALECKYIAMILSDEISWAIDTDGRKHPLDISLSMAEELLHPNDFYRINRGIILHRNVIIQAHSYFSGRLKLDVTLKTQEELIVSRDRVSAFKEWLAL